MSTKFSELWKEATAEEAPATSSKFSSLWEQATKKKGALEKAARTAAQYGIGAAEVAGWAYDVPMQMLSSPKTTKGAFLAKSPEILKVLDMKKRLGNWTEKDQAIWDDIVGKLEDPSKINFEPFDYTIGGLAEKGAKALGYDLKPEGAEEHGARIVGNLRNPKQLLQMAKNAPKFIQKLASSEARKMAKTEANWKRLSSVAKGNPEKRNSMKFAKDEGLSPEATNLLFQSNGKVEYLTKVAAKTKKFKGTITELNEKLGKSYEKLKALGREGGYLSFEESEALIGDIEKLKAEMKNTLVEVPEMGAVEKSLENAINKGTTVETLINSRQALSKGIKWGDIDRGDYFKKQLKDVFTKAIEQKNPYVAEQLKKTDEAWSMYEKYKPVLDKKIPLIKFHKFEIPSAMIAPALLTYSTFLGPGFVAGAKVAAGLEGLRRLAIRALMDPRFNKPFKQLREALIHGDTSGFKKSFMIIKNIAKDDDLELYEELQGFEFD